MYIPWKQLATIFNRASILVQVYDAFTPTWLMSFLQTLNFHCFRLLKEKIPLESH